MRAFQSLARRHSESALSSVGPACQRRVARAGQLFIYTRAQIRAQVVQGWGGQVQVHAAHRRVAARPAPSRPSTCMRCPATSNSRGMSTRTSSSGSVWQARRNPAATCFGAQLFLSVSVRRRHLAPAPRAPCRWSRSRSRRRRPPSLPRRAGRLRAGWSPGPLPCAGRWAAR